MTDILSSDETVESPLQDQASVEVPEVPEQPKKQWIPLILAAVSGIKGKIQRFHDRNPNRTWISLGAIGVFVVSVLIWFLFIATHPERMTADSASWDRKIEVVKFVVVRDDGWSHPSDAYDIDRSWRQSGTRQVYAGTESYSCGTTSNPRTCTRTKYRTEPVYDWWYEYKINRWRFSRHVWTRADNKSTPFWGDLSNEHFDENPVLGNEKLSGKRSETYVINLKDSEGDIYREELSLAQWTNVVLGRSYVANVTQTGIIRSVKW